MGVSGSGKSSIGQLLSEKLGLPFFDGDDFHPEENIIKMRDGKALTDNDRQPWLENVRSHAKIQLESGSLLFACSALKEAYRKILSDGINASFIYLQGSKELILARIQARKNHFMPSTLLDSQFATLEEPKNALIVDVTQHLDQIADDIINHIHK